MLRSTGRAGAPGVSRLDVTEAGTRELLLNAPLARRLSMTVRAIAMVTFSIVNSTVRPGRTSYDTIACVHVGFLCGVVSTNVTTRMDIKLRLVAPGAHLA